MEESSSLVSFSGWLREKTSVFRLDKRWFCVLSDTGLDLFADEDNSDPIHHFTQDDIVEVRSIYKYSAPGIQVEFKNGQCINFVTTSILDAQRWLCALNSKPISENISISDFKLLKVIGRGASGKVFLARMNLTGDLYAIKVIRKDHLTVHARESRIVAERNILMRATHPFITRLFFAFQTSTKLYFVLEYVAGGDLKHHLNKGIEFSHEQIRIFLAELVVALKTLHGLDIIYRDLKPENILVDLQGHLKLADFGLSREIDHMHEGPYSLCGTYEYVAPEMLREEAQTFTLDWWGLGIVAFLLYTGYLPYQSANRQRLFDMISNNPPRIPPVVDKTAASLIRALLEKIPARRLGSPGTDICGHEYFMGLDWGKVERKEYSTCFQPQISRDDSVSNFDDVFTQESPNDSYVEPSSIQMNIRDFSYEAIDVLAEQVPLADFNVSV